MLIYKVYLDLSLVISRLREFQLMEYNSAFPIVFMEASNPDDACFKAVYTLIQMILKQSNTVETRILCRSIKRDIRVIKALCR
ncbi:MAG: hypothetical protein FI729_01775 [SAR202 cluster bacterium]|nr:hypothetical protein [SAR202 cluster bacterium]|tara:strand:- start:16218 stop:16466 length:249 start_codon:yes stop_codon:yes gene_type:complete